MTLPRLGGVAAAAAVGLVVIAVVLLNRHTVVRNPSGSVLEAGGSAFDPIRSDEIQSILPEDAIPAITRPEYLAAAAADIRDDEDVIGLSLNGQARAFPTATMSAHEIVNDVIGGQPVAVTW